MIYFKSCPRCQGDVVVEEWLGQKDATCLQCGYRGDPQRIESGGLALIDRAGVSRGVGQS
jgi:hypothetical protein